MESNSEKNHLDDLFARKLGKLERPPSPDGFARLQQRMQGEQAQPRIVFWRNSAVPMAAAACLAVIMLLGWLYASDQSTTLSGGPAVAVTDKRRPTTESVPDKQPVKERAENDKMVQQLADNKPVSEQAVIAKKLSVRTSDSGDQPPFKQNPRVANAPLTNTTGQRVITTEPMTDKSVTMPNRSVAVSGTAVAPKPATERVLIVTIEEPEALVAARQTARSVVNNMPVLAANPTKEGKASFWSQVKRLKQDDDMARQEGSTDESGLLSRAYKGIRQKLEKDKPAKQ